MTATLESARRRKTSFWMRCLTSFIPIFYLEKSAFLTGDFTSQISLSALNKRPFISKLSRMAPAKFKKAQKRSARNDFLNGFSNLSLDDDPNVTGSQVGSSGSRAPQVNESGYIILGTP